MTNDESAVIAEIRARQEVRGRGDGSYSEAEHDLALLLGVLDAQPATEVAEAKPQK